MGSRGELSRSSGPSVEPSGGNGTNAIDLTGLDESDADIVIKKNGNSLVKIPRSRGALNDPTATVNTTAKRSRESSSDENDLMLALRKGKRRSNNVHWVEKCKHPQEKDEDDKTTRLASSAARDGVVNTAILLNVDPDELKGPKHPKIDGRHSKRSGTASNAHNQVARDPVADPILKQQPRYDRSTQSVSSKVQEQSSLKKKASSVDVISSHHRATKSRVRGKGTLNNHGLDQVQRPDQDSAGNIKAGAYDFHAPGSETRDTGPKDGSAFAKTHKATTSKEYEAKEKRAKDARAARISEDKVSNAAAQMRALQARHPQPRNTILVDSIDTRRRKVRTPGVVRANRQLQLPRNPQASRQIQPLPQYQPRRQAYSSQQPQREASFRQQRPQPNVRVTNINKEDFQDAAAQIQMLQAQHTEPRRPTLINRLPANLPRQKQRPTTGRINDSKGGTQNLTSDLERRAANRRRRIEAEVKEKFTHESEEFRARFVDQRFDEYLSRAISREAARQRTRNEEHLTVEGLEAMGDASSDSEYEEPIVGRIPLSQALKETNSGFVTQYVVLASEPHEGCKKHDQCLKRRQAYGELELANAYAEQLLKGTTPKPSKSGRPSKAKKPPPRLQIDSYQETYKDGMLSGLLQLANGKVIYCEVRKEQQAIGVLDPNVLRKKWARKEFIQLYRKRYDVWLTKVVPIAFSEREEQDEDEQNKRKKTLEEKREQKKQEEQNVTAETRQDKDGDRVEDASPRNATQDQDMDIHDNNNDGGDYDAASEASSDCSVSSTSTMQQPCPPSPPHRSHHPSRHPGPNPWLYEEYRHILCGSYTDLRLANEAAFRAAKNVWKPRSPNLDAWEHYSQYVQEAIEQERQVTDMDDDRADLVFPVPAWHGHDDHRPWGFVHSRISVQETVLEGPRDIGAEFVGGEEGEGEVTDKVRDDAEVVRGEQEMASTDPVVQSSAQDRSFHGDGDGDGGGRRREEENQVDLT